MTLDPRLHACRPDLADIRLQGQTESAQFVSGKPRQITASIASVHREPNPDAMQLTQALYGEQISVFEEQAGWLWGQLRRDGYVGYIQASAAGPLRAKPTHHVAVPLTWSYPKADIKTQSPQLLTHQAQVCVVEQQGQFARLDTGRFVMMSHLAELSQNKSDFATEAEKFLHTPYLWGGKSVLGIDCSGLVQTALQACGIEAPRDSDMQESAVGEALDRAEWHTLRRGDLLFWKGHVGIMQNATQLLHANGSHMLTVSEALSEAVARISKTGSEITSIRRLRESKLTSDLTI